MGNPRSLQADCRFDKALDDKSHPLIEPTQGHNRNSILGDATPTDVSPPCVPSDVVTHCSRPQEWLSEQLPLAACLLCCGAFGRHRGAEAVADGVGSVVRVVIGVGLILGGIAALILLLGSGDVPGGIG